MKQNGNNPSRTSLASTGGNRDAAIDAAKFISFNSQIKISGASPTIPL